MKGKQTKMFAYFLLLLFLSASIMESNIVLVVRYLLFNTTNAISKCREYQLGIVHALAFASLPQVKWMKYVVRWCFFCFCLPQLHSRPTNQEHKNQQLIWFHMPKFSRSFIIHIHFHCLIVSSPSFFRFCLVFICSLFSLFPSHSKFVSNKRWPHFEKLCFEWKS